MPAIPLPLTLRAGVGRRTPAFAAASCSTTSVSELAVLAQGNRRLTAHVPRSVTSRLTSPIAPRATASASPVGVPSPNTTASWPMVSVAGDELTANGLAPNSTPETRFGLEPPVDAGTVCRGFHVQVRGGP